MNYKNIIIGILSVVLIYGVYSSYTFSRAQQHDAQSLVVGIAAGYAPYVSINSQGQYEGFDIDVAQALATQLNKKLVLRDLGSMAPLMLSLEQGSIDIIMWGLTITQDRLRKLAMIHYQGACKDTNPLIFWQNIPAQIKTLDDLKGMTICIEPASFQSDIIACYPDINIVATEKVDDALLNIQYGKADAAFLDPEIAKKFKAKCPEIQLIDMPLHKDQQTLGLGIAIKKDNSAMIQDISAAIEQLKSNGTLTQLEQKWGLT